MTRHCLQRATLMLCLLLLAAAVRAQPVNDAFVNAIVLSGAEVQSSGSNVGATREPGEPTHGGVAGSASVWWRWTAPASVRVKIDTVGSSFDTVLAVYTGTAVNQLTAIASNDDTSGIASEVRFNAVAGTTYQIAVDGFLAGQTTATGSITLNLLAANPVPIITSNPAPGVINLPATAVGELSRATIDLISTGGAPGTSAGIDCVGTGVLVGAAGSSPTVLRFAQSVTVGQQPVDLSIAAASAPTAQSLSLACTIDPSEGPNYALSFSVLVPAGLAANAGPQVIGVPSSGSRIAFPNAAIDTSPLAVGPELRVTGTGAGSTGVMCTAAPPLLISPGDFLLRAEVSFSLIPTARSAVLLMSAPIRAEAYAVALSCRIGDGTGPNRTLSYTIDVPAGIPPGVQRWQAEGPASAIGGQSENIGGALPNAVSGAVHVVLPHPTDANVLTIGSVNGGVWRTQNALAAAPQWRPRTDRLGSLSIGALVYDLGDATRRRMFAGVGRFSSYRSDGGARIGVLRSLDEGENWSLVSTDMAGRNISGLHVNGAVVVAAVNAANSGSCADFGLFRSVDGGATFAQLGAAQGLPAGLSTALVSHASAPATLFAHVDGAERCGGLASANGIFRSIDNGATWTRVGSAAMNSLLAVTGKLVRMQAIAGGNVVAAISDARLQGVFASADSGDNWTLLGFPQTFEGEQAIGIHPGGQGRLHLSVAIDPSNPNLVFVGGDRQPVGGNGSFPNSIGARGFTGRLFRGNRAAPGEWFPLTHNGTGDNSSPHADSRSMAFDAAGRLIQGDDGGVYARLEPASGSGRWITLNGDLQVSEQHSLAVDGLSGASMTGNQDNGTMRQDSIGQRLWRVISGGDGGDTAIDALQRDVQNESVGYTSSQNLGGFRRRTYTGETPVAVVLAELEPVGGGEGVTGQFVTPIATNGAAGHRLVIGGDNAVFESFDSGDTVQIIGEGIRARAIVSSASIAYGAQGSVDALYVAGCRGNSCTDGDDGIFVRRTLGTPLTLVRANTAPQVAQAVTIDRHRGERAFAVVADTSATRAGGQAILYTADFGVSWQDVTGNFPAEAGLARSLLYLSFGDLLLVGTNVGVYVASGLQSYRHWARLGDGLPNAPVYELDYDAKRNRVIAASLGRGSHSLQAPALRANPGWSGLWFDPAVDGQGFQFDVVPEQGLIVAAWYTHAPGSGRSNLLWLTGVGTIRDGSAEFSVFRSRGRFDAANATQSRAGSLRVRFDDCGRATATYQQIDFGAGPRSGEIALQRLSPDTLCQAFRREGAGAAIPPPSGNFQVGLNGTWFNPATNGQGMLIEYLADRRQLVVGWYAYEFGDTGSEQAPLWLTAIGPVSGNRATLPVTLTRGGDFVSASPPVTRTEVGTLTIDVLNCSALTAQYTLTIDDVQRTGTIPLQRVTATGLCR